MRLVLASASPRRRELLARLGLPFDVVPSGASEALLPGLPILTGVADLALRKARDVAARIQREQGGPAVVLGADTLVVLDGWPFGKPASPADARRMLTALAGRTHAVVTAVGLVESGVERPRAFGSPDREATETVVSRVIMRPYSAGEIEAYLATPEPYDKAGAYAVQGAGGQFVLRVEGCYTNVVGLPLTTTARLLRAFGLPAGTPEAATDRLG
ncbi:MAG TPA: Maf family protein [Methylomirabilota bacterium]|jgi:septum formation protein|nr:Maf family protein [Methylomirabilota bacterium]